MQDEMVSTETRPYSAVRFHDAGRERWLIVRSSGQPVVVAEALGGSTAVLIAESMNDGIVLESERPPTATELYGRPVHTGLTCAS